MFQEQLDIQENVKTLENCEYCGKTNAEHELYFAKLIGSRGWTDRVLCEDCLELNGDLGVDNEIIGTISQY
jgi:hypothetical protein